MASIEPPCCILGLGKSGLALARLLQRLSIPFFAFDDTDKKVDGIDVFSKGKTLPPFKTLFVSPGIHPDHALYQKQKQSGGAIIGEADFALSLIRKKVVAVSGTNGKTHVCHLLEHILRSQNIAAKACGNIGLPLSDLVFQQEEFDLFIVELSSYQLETMKGRSFEASLFLNLSMDHMERYGSLQSYFAAKFPLVTMTKEKQNAFVHESLLKMFPEPFDALDIFPVKEQKAASLFPHLAPIDCINAYFSFLAASCFSVSFEPFCTSLKSYVKPRHRLETVGLYSDILFINDSKATNVDAGKKALESMKRPTILLAGGVDKGGGYDELVLPATQKCKHVFLFGQAAPLIQEALSASLKTTLCKDMEEAFSKASSFAAPGDAVLLSPCCSSFDQFKNYEERGDLFVNLVERFQKKGC